METHLRNAHAVLLLGGVGVKHVVDDLAGRHPLQQRHGDERDEEIFAGEREGESIGGDNEPYCESDEEISTLFLDTDREIAEDRNG